MRLAVHDWRPWDSTDDLQRHYKRVRARLYRASPPPSPPLLPPPDPPPATVPESSPGLLDGARRLTRLHARIALRLVCEETGIRALSVLSDDRRSHLVRARWLCWAICADAGMSYTQIGQQFRRDHSTVMSGLRNVSRLRVDKCYNDRLSRLIDAARAAVRAEEEKVAHWSTVRACARRDGNRADD